MTARSGAVLVADDDKINRIMLSRLLDNEGYQATTVEDGSQALEAVARESFDAVLLDIMMPGVDGIEVLRTLKSDSRWWHIPVIMVSAIEETDSIAQCIELGAEDYLLKPFDPVLLRARVNACLARTRFHDLEDEYHAIVKEQRAQLAELNDQLSQRVWAQAGELERLGRLRRFLPSQAAEHLAASGWEARLGPHRADVVVVAFTLSGVAALAEAAEPGEVVRILNGFHATLAALLEDVDAMVASAGVDAVTVVFNDPIPCPGAAVSARRVAEAAASDLSAALDEWRRRHGVPLTLGIGIASGTTTLGQVGPEHRCDYAAAGVVVERARQLAQDTFPAGGILIDDPTRSALEQAAQSDREP